MGLSVRARVAARAVDVSFEVAAGETVALLGPNGAGKSTVLGVAAGLIAPDAGRVVLEDRVLVDSARGVLLPPHRRGVSLLAQEALLFPHLDVLANVAFGPRSAGLERGAAEEHARARLDEVGALDLAGRRPRRLSGGQAQRVAVARAISTDPALLLLDEPLAALDVSVAATLRRVLRTVLADRTALIVTHDPLDAYLLADRVLVMESGRVVDSGPTSRVLARPRSAFAAALAGLDLLSGDRTARGIRLDAAVSPARPEVVTATGGTQGRVAIAVRPAEVRVLPAASDAPGAVPVVVTEVESRGGAVRIRAAGLSADVSPAEAAELDLAPGSRAHFALPTADQTPYPLGGPAV